MKAKLILTLLLVVRLNGADAEKPLRRPAARAAAGVSANGTAGFERVLTDEQRKQLREFMQEQGADFRENMPKLAQLRRELQEAAFTGKADEKFIKEKTDAIAKLDAEQLRVRTLALTKVAANLTVEQREKIKEMSERIRAERPGLGAGLRDSEAPRKREPAAPAPPDK
jgi:Spy/CpxP family protein refolding chaperone